MHRRLCGRTARALPFAAVLAAGCGADDAPPCGAGTVLKSGECVPESELECGEGTVAMDGECVPEEMVACGIGTVEENGQCVPDPTLITPSVADMVTYACRNGICVASDVVYYWRRLIRTDPRYDGTGWDDHAIERTITFRDDGDTEADYSLEVTDASGDPADLTFESGVPVTLTLVNPPTGATRDHYLTAPKFYRTVAWRQAATADSAYRGPNFDAFRVLWSDSAAHEMKLTFVPVEAGVYDAYCETQVTEGQDYTDIVEGSVTPNLNTGHAGAGMKGTITVEDPAGLDLTVFQGEVPRLVANDDPRRSTGDGVWNGLAGDDGLVCTNDANELVECKTITFLENSDMTLGYSPSSLTFTRDTAYVLRVINPGTNMGGHYLTAPAFFQDAVLSRAGDTQGEVKASYLREVVVANDGAEHTADLYLVPTVARTYDENYCAIGVQHDANGAPNFDTGHAGSGMIMSFDVVP